MKKLVLLIVVSLFYVSNLTAQKNNPYDYVGQEHNKGLDYIYQKLVKAKKANKGKNLKFTKNTLKSFIVNATTEFMQKNNKKRKLEIEKIFNNDIIIFPFPPPLSPTFPNIPVEYKNKVPKQLEFTLKDILNTAKKENEKDIVNLVDKIKKGKLSQKDKEIALSAASVAYHSIIYWKNGKNIIKWKSLSQKSNGAKKSFWKGLAGADVAGGVGGAVYAAVINAIPGAGQAAYGATILATGLGASASYAVSLIF